MAVTIIKPTVVVDAGLTLLTRGVTLPALVWRDAAGDFAGAKDDTISIRVPAYATARTRVLRSGSSRTRDNLAQRKVDVTLDTDVYKDVIITDEQLSLDIRDFATDVLNPIIGGIAMKLEDVLVSEITGATYANTIEFALGTDDAWKDLILAAREYLNNARVPMNGRVLALGSAFETELLGTDLFVKANESGGTTTLTDAVIGRKAGFTVVSCPAFDPEFACAFHKSAFVMSSRAPQVPAGAPYGASASQDGFAMRVVRVLDSTEIEDILAVDSWVGTNVVTDNGSVDGNGVFTPSEDPDDSSGADDLFVRAVKITTGSV